VEEGGRRIRGTDERGKGERPKFNSRAYTGTYRSAIHLPCRESHARHAEVPHYLPPPVSVEIMPMNFVLLGTEAVTLSSI
jgi:hypothetical protein